MLKTIVIKLKNGVNGNPRYRVKFNYMSSINEQAFRRVKDGFTFTTYDTVRNYLSENVERFEESELVIVQKEKDYHF